MFSDSHVHPHSAAEAQPRKELQLTKPTHSCMLQKAEGEDNYLSIWMWKGAVGECTTQLELATCGLSPRRTWHLVELMDYLHPIAWR